jgi:hypothetical protein
LSTARNAACPTPNREAGLEREKSAKRTARAMREMVLPEYRKTKKNMVGSYGLASLLRLLARTRRETYHQLDAFRALAPVPRVTWTRRVAALAAPVSAVDMRDHRPEVVTEHAKRASDSLWHHRSPGSRFSADSNVWKWLDFGWRGSVFRLLRVRGARPWPEWARNRAISLQPFSVFFWLACFVPGLDGLLGMCHRDATENSRKSEKFNAPRNMRTMRGMVRRCASWNKHGATSRSQLGSKTPFLTSIVSFV